MSVVSLLNVAVKNNPAPFGAPYEFEITFECLEPLQKDLEWKVTYVGSATSAEHDQVLDTLLVGPIPVGVNKFVFETEAPDLSKIPNTEIIGVTVVLLSCSYDDREFVRVGYYVNNEYSDPALVADPPAKPVVEKVVRNILAEKPRVTRFAIKWDSEESAPAEYPPEQPDVDLAEDDEAAYAAEEAAADAEEADADASAAEGAPADQDDDEEEEEDAAMGDADEKATASSLKAADDDDAASEAGSEDLEAESSGEDDEEGEEEDEEVDGDAMDVSEDAAGAQGQNAQDGEGVPMENQTHQAQSHDVMVH